MVIDLFTDTAAILISIVSNSHYGMPRGQIHINLPPGHPIMSFEMIQIKMAAVSVKRSIARIAFITARIIASLDLISAVQNKVHLIYHFIVNHA